MAGAHKPDVVILTGKVRRGRGFIPAYRGSSLSSRFITRQFGVFTEGIIAANVVNAGYPQPPVSQMSDPRELANAEGKIALVSVNDVIALRYLVGAKDVLLGNFEVLFVGGQVPSQMPNVVKYFLPEGFNIVVGECEGNMGALLASAEGGARGQVFRFAPSNLLKDYVLACREKHAPYLSMIEIGRGCNNACPFCGLDKYTTHRWREPEQVIEEIRILIRMGRRRFMFVDPDLSSYSDNVLEPVFGFIEKNRLSWAGEASSRLKGRRVWDLMSRTGISLLTGAEVFTGEYSDLPKNTGGLLENKNGCDIVYSYIFGAPGQTRQNVQRSIQIIREKGWTMVPQLFAPYPGTLAFVDAVARGRVLNPDIGVFDRKNVVIACGMSPKETLSMFRRFNREVHSITGTMRLIARAILDSSRPGLAFSRILSILAFRVRAFLEGWEKPKRKTHGTRLILPKELAEG